MRESVKGLPLYKHLGYLILIFMIYKGSIGNLASAATVAASSFGMKIQDPRHLIEHIDPIRWQSLNGRGSLRAIAGEVPHYVEPFSPDIEEASPHGGTVGTGQTNDFEDRVPDNLHNDSRLGDVANLISGKVQRLGDFVDTDAVSS